MMFSVPDTAFGAAVAKFLVLFQKRPVTLRELHAAFADMSSIATRDHPQMPWPIKQTNGDGMTSTLIVEGWLAVLRSHYTHLPSREDSAVVDKLALWHGAQAKATVTSKPWPTELQLHFTKKMRTARVKTLTEQLGALVAPCAWRLWRETTVVVSSSNADSLAQKVFSATLKGAEVLDIHVEPGGVLVLVFNKGIWIEIQPDDFAVVSDYDLHIGTSSYYRFAGNFVESEQLSPEAILALE